jgi:hypothetical protein
LHVSLFEKISEFLENEKSLSGGENKESRFLVVEFAYQDSSSQFSTGVRIFQNLTRVVLLAVVQSP